MMLSNMKTYSFIAMLSIAVAQVRCLELPMETASGRCPIPKTIKNFQPQRLQGVWYDIKRYKNTILKGSCGTATYNWYPNNNSFVTPYRMLEYPTNTLTFTGVDVPNGIFQSGLNGLPTPFEYWLLDTDYENYHVFYTCVEIIPALLNSQSINIMSRKSTLAAQYLGPIFDNLTRNKLDVTILRNVQQDNTVCGRNRG